MKKEKLELSIRQKAAHLAIILEKNLEVGDFVFYESQQHEVISIYSEKSPLCGYILLSGLGSPILPTKIQLVNENTTSQDVLIKTA